jgi:hypothetical protein
MGHVIGRFSTMDDARRAIADLELAGVDAARVEVRDEPAILDPAEQRTVDLEETGAWGRRAAIGAIVGAVVGAGLLTAILVVAMGDVGSMVVLSSVIGGMAFGAAIGGYWAVAGRLPVNEQAMSMRAPEEAHTGRYVELDVRIDSDDDGRRIRELLSQRAIDVGAE